MRFEGRKHTPETIEKMRQAQKGRVVTPETREKLRAANLGNKLSDEMKKKISIESKKHAAEFVLRTTALMKGVPKSPGHRAKIAAANKGKKFSEEHRRNISASWEHRTTYTRTPETKAKMSASIIRSIQQGNGKRKDTSIELAVRGELTRIGIEHKSSTPLAGVLVDIYIPEARLVIECDGCYWHCCPTCGICTKDAEIIERTRTRDKGRDARLHSAGYSVLRFWEHEINADAGKCAASVADYIRRNLDALKKEYDNGIW